MVRVRVGVRVRGKVGLRPSHQRRVRPRAAELRRLQEVRLPDVHLRAQPIAAVVRRLQRTAGRLRAHGPQAAATAAGHLGASAADLGATLMLAPQRETGRCEEAQGLVAGRVAADAARTLRRRWAGLRRAWHCGEKFEAGHEGCDADGYRTPAYNAAGAAAGVTESQTSGKPREGRSGPGRPRIGGARSMTCMLSVGAPPQYRRKVQRLP